jgi:hypothetical protein
MLSNALPVVLLESVVVVRWHPRAGRVQPVSLGRHLPAAAGLGSPGRRRNSCPAATRQHHAAAYIDRAEYRLAGERRAFTETTPSDLQRKLLNSNVKQPGLANLCIVTVLSNLHERGRKFLRVIINQVRSAASWGFAFLLRSLAREAWAEIHLHCASTKPSKSISHHHPCSLLISHGSTRNFKAKRNRMR